MPPPVWLAWGRETLLGLQKFMVATVFLYCHPPLYTEVWKNHLCQIVKIPMIQILFHFPIWSPIMYSK